LTLGFISKIFRLSAVYFCGKVSGGIIDDMAKKLSQKNKKVVVAVSGGFDPLHIGHVRMFQEAKKLGDELVVILNNDNWLKKKKGYAFMHEQERKEVIENLRAVDRVIISGHKENDNDMSVSAEILKVKPHIFGKGGDRNPSDVPIPGSEVDVCEKIGCEIVYNLGEGGKVQSSSWLLADYAEKTGKGKEEAK
jgi:D-beta-D-heptose 7-phosphate kinase/D-beta-D-heptose 1-phosphate adenosyltransferase